MAATKARARAKKAVAVKPGHPQSRRGLTTVAINTNTLDRVYKFTITPKNGRPVLLAIHL